MDSRSETVPPAVPSELSANIGRHEGTPALDAYQAAGGAAQQTLVLPVRMRDRARAGGLRQHGSTRNSDGRRRVLQSW
ncbi:MAG: hypothetical protein DCF30_00560 [Hyphomicrobiales bacterium]|nr:MAG: hypothetical protein DCF30_00560 [Hyphomicrobiales bacterium]